MDINPIKLVDFAKIASNRYLKGGESLNDAIAKLANEHELTPMQIRRVAEYANHDANLSLHKQATDKTFTFELANPDKIIGMVRGTSMSKTAGVAVSDVLECMNPSLGKNAESWEKEMPSLHIEEAERDPSLAECRMRNVNFLLDKLAAHAKLFKREMRGKIASYRADISESMEKIAEMAKEHILDNKGKLSDLFKYACILDPDYAKVFKISFQRIKEDMIEKLGAPVDKALISDNLEIPDGTLEILNGEHTLAVVLDTLKNKISDEDKSSQRLQLLGTFGTAVVDQMDVLKTPEDVEQNLEDSLDNLSKKAEEGLDAFVELLEKCAMSLPAKALLLAGTGLGLKAMSDIARETTKGAIKSSAKERDERKRLEELAVRRRLY